MDEDRRQDNNNLVNNINGLVGQAQNIKFASRFAVTLGLPFWAALAGALILAAIVIAITGGPGNASENTKGGQPVQNTSPSICIKWDPILCLQDFNIQAVGFENNRIFALEVYSAFLIAYNQSPLYRQLWNKGGKKLILTYGKPAGALVGEGNDCQGQAFPAADAPNGTQVDDMMNIWNWGKCGFWGGEAYLIIHETGHILAGRNIQLFNRFSQDALASSDGDKCYKNWNGSPNYLKTYIGPGADSHAEGFAEGIADYVLYRSWQSWNPQTRLSNFQTTECPKTYDWLKQNIFGVDIQPPAGL